MDLFEYNKLPYLLVVDYYSRYIEIAKLSSTTSANVINHIKSIFSRHGIPESVMSDNGPQFSAQIFKDFADSYGFRHITSSPHYPQSNGEAERAVQTVKNLLKKSKDPYLGLLSLPYNSNCRRIQPFRATDGEKTEKHVADSSRSVVTKTTRR
jgi:transposase InsO family protein